MRNPQDFEKVVTYAFPIVTISFRIIAIAGYYMVCSTVEDQISISFRKACDDCTRIKALTWLMVFIVFAKYTLNPFPGALGM